MSDPTEYLTKLTCAVQSAQDLGHANIGRVFERLRQAEEARL